MEDKSKKTNLKIKILEEQVETKEQRIKYLNELRTREKQAQQKNKSPSLADDLFLDIFNFFKLG